MRIKVAYNRLPNLPEEVVDKLELIVGKVAFDAQESAVNRAPYDTGALRASIFVVTFRSSNAANAIIDAKSKNPDALFADSEPVKHRLHAKIIVPIHYAVYHEMGWAKRPAHPFLEPAVMAQASNFKKAMSYVLNNIGGTP